MSEPISRQDLEMVLGTYRDDSRNDAVLILRNAAVAILDAPPVEWCETHGASRGRLPTYPLCLDSDSEAPCQFATYVRVKVAP